MAKKTTTKAAPAAEPISDAELNHPTTDGYEGSEHKHGMPLPRNKRKPGDGATCLSAAEVAEIHGAEVIAKNEEAARKIRASQQ